MRYVVIQTGGKQYKVAEGDTLTVERLVCEKDQVISLSNVLLYVADGTIKVGMPQVDGVSVKARVIDNIKGPKIRVSHFKAKARHRRTVGHRQYLTSLKIEEILVADKKPVAQKEKTTEVKPVHLKARTVVKK